MSSRTDLKLWLRRKVDLSRHTTMHVGGPAEYFAEPTHEEELIELIEFSRQEALPFMILGRGSNVIFSDHGYPGMIISMNHYHSDQVTFDPDPPLVTASAGTPLCRLATLCRDHGLGGCEFLSSIPGSLGGALVMNAGFSRFSGQTNQIGDIVEEVVILNEDGKKAALKASEIVFCYRHSSLKGKIVLSGTLHLWKRKSEEIDHEIKANFEYRSRIQNVRYPSSGSIFKNPSGSALSAGKLLDGVGLKGMRVGDAMVSQEHANYMINLGNAKSSDFEQLIKKVQQAVLNATGIILETEVILA